MNNQLYLQSTNDLPQGQSGLPSPDEGGEGQSEGLVQVALIQTVEPFNTDIRSAGLYYTEGCAQVISEAVCRVMLFVYTGVTTVRSPYQPKAIFCRPHTELKAFDL